MSMTVGELTATAAEALTQYGEREVRVDLAACYRLIDEYGMSDLIGTHLSARVPGHHDQFLLNSYGLMFDEMTASSLYRLHLDGTVIKRPDNPYGVNHAAYIIHSGVLAARDDVNCVVHTHSVYSMAVSAMECGLLPLTQHAMRFYGKVSYHDYEGVAVNEAERERLGAHLAGNSVMFLRNHGLLVAASSVPEAFRITYAVEKACETQVHAMTSGAKLIEPPEEVLLETANFDRAPYASIMGNREWEGLLRRLDRRDPSFRD
jgi:ribulose-5-phosphate 4-epimerase/fuculose-1-phosphate aldolase